MTFPIATEDLTVLLERDVTYFDPYADFSNEGNDIEGVTEFRRGDRPTVRIAARLTEIPTLENRLRTTLTHEYGHVHLHDSLYQVESKPGLLFDMQESVPTSPEAHRCKRDSMVSFTAQDWMEWQAGYVCGAMLIPFTTLMLNVRAFRKRYGLENAALSEQTSSGRALIDQISQDFQTSRDAARVRLLQTRVLSPGRAESLPLH